MRGSRVTVPVGLVRTMQIIVAALMVGCLCLLVVALAVKGGPKQTSAMSMSTYLLSAASVCLVLAGYALTGVFVARARRKIRLGTWSSPVQHVDAEWAKQNTDIGKLVQVLVSQTILAASIMESAVLLSLVAYFLEQSPLSLTLAVLLILALAAYFPTADKIETWLDEQMRLLEEERTF
jgi:hypothetical protein